MRWLFLLLTVCGLALSSAAVFAQEDAPILVLNAGGIEAVSPLDGSAVTLVAPPPDVDALRELTYDPVTVFSAEWLSPDGGLLAYRTLSDAALASREAQETLEHVLFLLDLTTGESLPVTLPHHDGVDTHVKSVAWSADGQRLYIVGFWRNESASWWLAIFERDAWDTGAVVALPAPEYAFARRVLPASDGVTVLDTGIQSPRHLLATYDNDGALVTTFEVDWNVSADVNLYINSPFNPLLMDDLLVYGLAAQMSQELVIAIDPAVGKPAPVESGLFAALISNLAPDTSLRVSTSLNTGDMADLLVRSPDEGVIGALSSVRLYAHGVAWDGVGSTFALSPDGQTIAWVDQGELNLWHDGEVTSLGVEAEALAWAPPLYLPVEDKLYLAG